MLSFMRCLVFLNLIFFLFFIDNSGFASTKQYSKDLEQYQDLIVNLHPDPFRYRSKKDFLADLQQLQQQILQGKIADERQFLADLAKLNARLACSHTKIFPGAGILASLIKLPAVFPVPVKIVDQQVMVDSDQFPELPFGSRIISIDSEKTADLLQNLREFVAADAYQVEYIDLRIEESFPFYLAVAKGAKNKFRLQIQTPAGATIDHEVQATRLLAQQEYSKQRMTRQVFQHSASPIQLTIIKDKNVAFLRVQTFLAVPEEFASQIKQAFQRIVDANVEGLVIDLRGNDGGVMDNALKLAAHLMPSDIKPNIAGAVRSLTVDIHQGLRTINGQPFRAEIEEQLGHYLRDNFQKQTFEGFYRSNARFALNQTVPKAIPNFRHNVILLQDGGTASTALYFARLFRYEKRGLILGQSAGGRNDGFHGHILLRYQLEHSQMFVEIPLVKVDFPAPAEKTSSAFLLPDRTIYSDLKSWQQLTDQTALAALRFLDHDGESSSPAPQKR